MGTRPRRVRLVAGLLYAPLTVAARHPERPSTASSC